jgi:hypothetical protein
VRETARVREPRVETPERRPRAPEAHDGAIAGDEQRHGPALAEPLARGTGILEQAQQLRRRRLAIVGHDVERDVRRARNSLSRLVVALRRGAQVVHEPEPEAGQGQ